MWAEENQLARGLQEIQTKVDRNKPELISGVLERWKNSSSANADEESMGAVTSLGRRLAILMQAANWMKVSIFERLQFYGFVCVSCVIVYITKRSTMKV